MNAAVPQAATSIVDVIRFFAEAPRRLGQEESATPYSSVFDYVAKRGLVYESQALTADEQAWFRRVAGRATFPIKECYSNSQRFLWRAEGKLPEGWNLRYVEGYVLSLDVPLPIHHGWVTLNGKVIDLTLRRGTPTKKDRFSDRAIGAFTGREYLGVPFTWEQVHAFVIRTEVWGSLIDNMEEGWPLLRGQENP